MRSAQKYADMTDHSIGSPIGTRTSDMFLELSSPGSLGSAEAIAYADAKICTQLGAPSRSQE